MLGAAEFRTAAGFRQKFTVVAVPFVTVTVPAAATLKPPNLVADAVVVPTGTLIIVYWPLAFVVARKPPGSVTTALVNGRLVKQFVTVPVTEPRAGAVQVGNLKPPIIRVFQKNSRPLLATERYS